MYIILYDYMFTFYDVFYILCINKLFPGGAVAQNLPASAGDARDMGSVPGSGIFSGLGNGNPVLYSCLKNPTNRGAWQATVHGVPKSQTWLSDSACTNFSYTALFPLALTLLQIWTCGLGKEEELFGASSMKVEYKQIYRSSKCGHLSHLSKHNARTVSISCYSGPFKIWQH